MMGSRQRAHRTNRSCTTVGSDSGVVPASNVVVNDAPGPAVQSDSASATATVIPDGVPAAQKIKGAAQMAGGAALGAAGVPMCILPGPGVAAIAGGAALASKGQRNFSGRLATPVEAKLDAAAAKLGEAAKDQAAQAARTAAKKAPEVAGKAARTVARQAPKVADAVAKTAPKVADAVVRTAPKVADAVARTAPQVASKVAQTVPAAAERAAEAAPKVASAVAKTMRGRSK